MILKANQKYIDMSCVRHLLATGEKNADYLTFEISKKYHDVDLSECTFILRAVNACGNLVEQTLKKLIDNNSIFLTWTVDEYFTAVSGVLKLEIRGVKGDELVIKYDLSDIIVRESAVGEGLPEIPDTTVIQGEKGDKGDAGLSAYEIWLSIGNSGTEADFIMSLKGDKGDKGEQGLQGIKGEKGDTGGQGIQGETGEARKSAYETWLSFGNSGTETDFIASLKGARGEQGLQGIQGEIGLTGEKGSDGKNGKSAYETWLSIGNSGTEADFVTSLKGDKEEQGLQGIQGEKGDKGEQGLQGIQGEIGLTGESGKDGVDGFSPIIEVCENTETSYRLMIKDKTNTFKTPNLKGLNGVSGSGTSVTIDSELSGTSENPVQNKVISVEISTLKNQISNLNDLISTLQTGGGNLKFTTLFDSSDYEKYKNLWNFKCSYWDDRVFSFDETATKNTTF
ncbi:MAG: collagen-like protein [Ruminococcus sp.]|nr:collagen-like protein [Ruminococcus sp.]